LNLSEWYANEYIGLRVIHLLRLLCKDFNISQNIPIYLISHLTEFELLKRTELANILLSENVFRLDFEKDINYYENNLKNKIEVEKSLKENVKITPPRNIENNHSRENLYAIDEWRKSLGIENENVYDLYYVLETYKNPIKLKDISKIIDKYKQEFKNPIEGKVLVIENELEKGWKEIYDKLFEDSKVEIDYLFTDENKLFKPNSIDQIKELLKIKIEKFRPNFILLDFRLMESDYDAQDIEKISGFEVLKEIKNINFGIHVFLTSVSSQAKYLDRLYNVGLNGYIQKRFGSVKTPIEKLYDCLKIYQRIRESSKYYYDFEETFRVIEHNSNNPNKSDIQHLKSFMSYTRLSLRSLIYLNNKGGIDSNSFNIETAFVFAFIALESLTHYKYDKIDYDKRVFIEEKDCKIKKMSQYEELIDNSGNLKEPPSNQKIRNIIYLLDEIYYEDSKEGQEYRKEKEMLFKKRNNLIHNLGRNYIGEITMDDLSYLYQIICLSKNLINSTN
jgi:DNA-binding NarL/FixJ family response regulator